MSNGNNNPCQMTNRHDIINHLNNFHREVNRYIHTLPGIILNIPTTNVIQASMTLNWYIECLKNSLIDVMLKEGIGPHGDNVVLTPRNQHDMSSPGMLRREYPPSQPHLTSPMAMHMSQYNPGPIRASVCRPTARANTPRNNNRSAANFGELIRPISGENGPSFAGLFPCQNECENRSTIEVGENKETTNKSGLPRPFATN